MWWEFHNEKLHCVEKREEDERIQIFGGTKLLIKEFTPFRSCRINDRVKIPDSYVF